MTNATFPHLETLTSIRELLCAQREIWFRSMTVHSETRAAAIAYYDKRIAAVDFAFEVIATTPKRRLGAIIDKAAVDFSFVATKRVNKVV